MMQKGGIALILLILVVVFGLIIGVYFVAQSTGFLPKALESLPGLSNSATITIATSSAKPVMSPLASSSAKPKVSPSPTQSPEATSSAYQNPFEDSSYENPFASL